MSLSRQSIRVIVLLFVEFFSTMFHTFWGCMWYFATPKITNSILYRNLLENVPNANETVAIRLLEDPMFKTQEHYLTTAFVPALQAATSAWMLMVLWDKVCVVHFNPAVSLGLAIVGEFSFKLLIPFIISQTLGSIVGAATAQALRQGADIGPALVHEDASVPVIIISEILLCGVMCFFVYIMVGDKSYSQQTGPMAIGFVVFQGTLSGRWVNAGILNPGRMIGPAIVVGGKAWYKHWVWWVSDFLGATVFALIYKFFFATNGRAWIMKMAGKDEIVSDEEKKEDILLRTPI